VKLLQRTGRYYVLFSTLIFLVGAGGLFLALRYVMHLETDERLQDEKKALHHQLAVMDSLPSSIVILDNVIEIDPIPQFSPYEVYSDTLIWHQMESEHPMSFRKITFHDEINGKSYRISLNKSVLDTEEMLTTIVLAVIGILIFLLLTINLFNRYLSLRLWRPFYQTIQQIKEFSFDNNESPPPSVISDIDEFSTLQNAIHQMLSKALNDYKSLKRFSENASHEIQNPLAIIKSKIELLMQQDDLNENEQQAILHIQKAAGRLSRLNQSLLMLTRIENRQYDETSELNLKQLIENQLDFVEPLITAKNLQVKCKLKDVLLNMNTTLAEVLINNLFGNAIKHNHQEGYIHITLDNRGLKIVNSGKRIKISTNKLFDRFQKGDEASSSLGLGLALIKEICDRYGFDIQYDYNEDQHSLTLVF